MRGLISAREIRRIQHIIAEAARCSWCGKTRARDQQPGRGLVYAPVPIDPAIHCTCAPDQSTQDGAAIITDKVGQEVA